MTYQEVKALYAAHNYKFYSSGKFNVNIFGRRNKDLATVDKFNDILGIAFIDENGKEKLLEFPCTTKPGLTYLKDKLGNPAGTFILMPGQYLGAWKIGYHHAGEPNQYEALVQSGPGVFTGWRDHDADGKFDFNGPIYTDVQGLNGHKAGANSFQVGAWSAACQVLAHADDLGTLMSICHKSADLYGNKFTYTLFQDE